MCFFCTIYWLATYKCGSSGGAAAGLVMCSDLLWGGTFSLLICGSRPFQYIIFTKKYSGKWSWLQWYSPSKSNYLLPKMCLWKGVHYFWGVNIMNVLVADFFFFFCNISSCNKVLSPLCTRYLLWGLPAYMHTFVLVTKIYFSLSVHLFI